MRTASAWLLTSTWAKALRLRGLINAAHTVAKDEQDDAFAAATLMGSIDDAEGVYLDLIGKRLGCFPRPVFGGSAASDDAYKKVLRALGRAQRSDGSLPAFRETVEIAVREGITITDNQDMTVTVVIGADEEEAMRLALDCGALSLPAGVLLIIENTSAQVTGVTALEGDEQVELAWNAPVGAIVVGYCIQWKSGNQGYDDSRQTTVAGTETDATITGLANGTEYTFRVRAEATVGNGAFSNEVTATPQTVPDQVSGVSAAGTGTEITLTWDEPDDGGSPITEYWAQWKSGNQGYSSARRLEDITELEATITGLTSGTEYTFRVRAINANGNGAWSAEEMATPGTAPGRVTGLAATAGNESVSLAYDAPADGGSPILRYRIQWKSGEPGLQRGAGKRRDLARQKSSTT